MKCHEIGKGARAHSRPPYPPAPLWPKGSRMVSPNIDPTLAKALEARGYATLTPIQLAVLEPEARDRDLLVSARTGSGKTVAYGLALADTLLGVDGRLAPAGAPQALAI